jgi:F-type H+-transporting ATPase subunit alpha
MKQIAGSLRLDLAAYRELEAFAQLGTELDKATQKQLDRGARMVELLKQPQYVPMNVIDQVVSIFSASNGFVDDIGEDHVAAFEKALLEHFHTNSAAKAVWDELEKKKAFDNDLTAKLKKAIADFKTGWKAPA